MTPLQAEESLRRQFPQYLPCIERVLRLLENVGAKAAHIERMAAGPLRSLDFWQRFKKELDTGGEQCSYEVFFEAGPRRRRSRWAPSSWGGSRRCRTSG